MARIEDLYTKGPAAGSKAPILIAHFEGAMDAGSAGTLAVVQLLTSLSPERVATFDTDLLIDYRSHRPVMEVDEWVTTDMSEPEIALDLVHDDAGTPILLLHGPEPDARWKSFRDAVGTLAEEAGVEAIFSFHGLPAAVPHTRPATVHLQSTDRDVIPQQPLMGGTARFPAPLTSFLQYHLHLEGVTGATLLATVPYYLSDVTFPRASSALLRRLAEIADLQLPIGDLERGADEDASQVERLLEVNPDLQRTVQGLEQHFDSISLAAAEGIEIDSVMRGEEAEDATSQLEAVLPGWDDLTGIDQAVFPEAERMDSTPTDSMADAIGDAIESYLKTRSKQKPASEQRLPGSTGDDANSEGVEDGAGVSRPRPRHRAPNVWELDRLPEEPDEPPFKEGPVDEGGV
ncbi:MAG: PAC2 family protein [Actinomyces sp.]|nr:PAC2 family protein [Actinomyces sp.]